MLSQVKKSILAADAELLEKVDSMCLVSDSKHWRSVFSPI